MCVPMKNANLWVMSLKVSMSLGQQARHLIVIHAFKELESKVGKDKTILLLCRSGNRSAQTAEAAFNAGFEHIYNVLEGFEGDLNEQQQRNQKNGWRIHQLPWQQD